MQSPQAAVLGGFLSPPGWTGAPERVWDPLLTGRPAAGRRWRENRYRSCCWKIPPPLLSNLQGDEARAGERVSLQNKLMLIHINLFYFLVFFAVLNSRSAKKYHRTFLSGCLLKRLWAPNTISVSKMSMCQLDHIPKTHMHTEHVIKTTFAWVCRSLKQENMSASKCFL